MGAFSGLVAVVTQGFTFLVHYACMYHLFSFPLSISGLPFASLL